MEVDDWSCDEPMEWEPIDTVEPMEWEESFLPPQVGPSLQGTPESTNVSERFRIMYFSKSVNVVQLTVLTAVLLLGDGATQYALALLVTVFLDIKLIKANEKDSRDLCHGNRLVIFENLEYSFE
ncbi:hypothetical protein AVEN_247651-1 [Araneus ventricosus]|uniref:Uncharacterized protein n=1 Tax=Araneus ventricosus TaxID=182803 RepID=A0A4Y2RVE0_ARAVE|nr:hypothetical protein AVEN_247651-1 [Araneus ventricosus]